MPLGFGWECEFWNESDLSIDGETKHSLLTFIERRYTPTIILCINLLMYHLFGKMMTVIFMLSHFYTKNQWKSFKILLFLSISIQSNVLIEEIRWILEESILSYPLDILPWEISDLPRNGPSVTLTCWLFKQGKIELSSMQDGHAVRGHLTIMTHHLPCCKIQSFTYLYFLIVWGCFGGEFKKKKKKKKTYNSGYIITLHS